MTHHVDRESVHTLMVTVTLLITMARQPTQAKRLATAQSSQAGYPMPTVTTQRPQEHE